MYAKDWKGIISPLFGNPVLLNKSDSNKSFPLFVVTNNPLQPEHCSVTLQFGRRRYPLIISKIRHLQAEEIKTEFNEWTARNTGPLYEVTCTIPPEFTLPQKSPGSIDFSSGGEHFSALNAVFVFDKDITKLLFASDLHIAAIWDDIEYKYAKYIRKKGGKEPVNPNRNFEMLIEFANQLYASGEIDALVLGGDLVEYKYTDTTCKETNFTLMKNLLQSESGALRTFMPVFVLTGNHDYRLYPYEPVVTGLTALGAEPHTAHSFFREYYRGSKFIAVIKAFRSLQRSTGADHSLDEFYRTVNSRDVFSFISGKINYIFASSGSDAICTPRSFSKPGEWFKVLNSAAPQSEGLRPEQSAVVLSAVQKGNSAEAVVFCTHAPLWNKTRNKKDFPGCLLNANAIEYHDTETTPESIKLREGTIHNGNKELIQTAAGTGKPFIYISGHTHYPAVYAHTSTLSGIGYTPVTMNEEFYAEPEPGKIINIHSGTAGFFTNEISPQPASVLMLDVTNPLRCVFTAVTLPKLH